MDYETEKELKELMTSISDDLLELKAILDALIDINESNTTTCIVLEITRDLVRNVFNKNSKNKSLLDLI